MGSAGVSSTDWTFQSSSLAGYSSSGSSVTMPEPDAVGKIGGGSRLWAAGIAMDSVADKLVSMVDTGSRNSVAQCAIMAVCMNVRK